MPVSARNACLLAFALLALPRAAIPYEMARHTVDGGGARSTGTSVVITGTFGQPDAQRVANGAIFRMSSGFWAGFPPDALFADGYEDSN
jgi:hypothetical protein